MTDQHPITPSPELIKDWHDEWNESDQIVHSAYTHIAIRASQWGADQELEACNGWLVLNGHGEVASRLRAARRPMTEQKSTSTMINCHWDGPPPSPHASVSDWFEQEGSKGVLYGLRISPLPSRGGNRSPKPPSLKEQALALLDPSNTYGSITQEEKCRISVTNAEIIRRALEALPDE